MQGRFQDASWHGWRHRHFVCVLSASMRLRMLAEGKRNVSASFELGSVTQLDWSGNRPVAAMRRFGCRVIANAEAIAAKQLRLLETSSIKPIYPPAGKAIIHNV